MNDLRASIRSLTRRPFHSTVAIIILVLGLGASIAVFTYVNGFYQPFPGVDAGKRLVRVFQVEEEDAYQDLSYLDFLDCASLDGPFTGLAAVQPYYAASVRLESMTEVAFLEAVSGDYFSVLDIEIEIGRGLEADDDTSAADPAAVISHHWWQRSFNGDDAVIGSTIHLNYRPFTVVGVAAPTFLGSSSDYRPNVWIPIAPFRDRYTSWAARAEDREVPLVRVYGRLRDSVGKDHALASLSGLAAGLDELYPRKEGSRRFELGGATWIDPRSRVDEWSTVRLMMMAAGGLLLLVCANVANLLLSVAIERQREMTVRSALGASPWRLVRQVLIENVLLATLAGGIALVLAVPLTKRLGAYFARPSVWGANVAREVNIDLRVVAFALAAILVTGIAAGLLPAIRAACRDLTPTLRTDSDASSGTPKQILGRRIPDVRDLLVSAQVALATILLVAAGLVLRTLDAVSDLEPGFEVEQMVVTHISTSSTDLEPAARDRFFRDLSARLTEEPWVRSATIADYPLLSPHSSADLLLDGRDQPTSLVYSRVIPGFFEALGIELSRGRTFVDSDEAGSPEVAIVNETLAQRFFAGENPLGRRLRWPQPASETDRVYEVVGVVRDTRTQDIFAEPPPTVYFSYSQQPQYPTGAALLVSSAVDPQAAVPQLSRWLREYEPYLAIVNVVPYQEIVRGLIYTHRMNAEMFSLLASLALILSVAGIGSVVSLAVSRRAREIGIRMAIGAERSDVGRMIVGRALSWVALGLGIGLAGAVMVSDLLQGLLFGIEPTDPLSVVGGVGALVLAALVAAYLPARRATTIEPTIALRDM